MSVFESDQTGNTLAVPEPSTLPEDVANISARSRPAETKPLLVARALRPTALRPPVKLLTQKHHRQ